MNRRTTISREVIAASGAVTLEDYYLQQALSTRRPYGRFYFSEGQGVEGEPAAGAEGGAAAAVAEDEPEVAGGESAAGEQAAAAEDTCTIPFRNFEHLGLGNDLNKVIAQANKYQELEQGGYVELAAKAGEQEMDGFFLTSSLLAQARAQGPAGEAAAGAAQQAGEQAAQQAAAQGVQLTQEELDRYVDQKLQEHFTRRDQQMTLEGQVGEEQSRYGSILTDIGFAPKEYEVEIAGQTSKMDAVREFLLLPAFRALTQHHIDRRLNKADPAYADKRNQPASAEIQALAAKDLQTVMALIGSITQETIADRQVDLPGTTGGEGPAGRAQTDHSKLTPEQRRQRGIQSARARGALRGEYDK